MRSGIDEKLTGKFTAFVWIKRHLVKFLPAFVSIDDLMV